MAYSGDSTAILNAIRNEASLAYQERVPAATQSNLESTIDNIFSARPLVNEVASQLINRIGLDYIRTKVWENPFKTFKKGMLLDGDKASEIALGLIKAKTYDPADPAQFDNKNRPVPNWQAFHQRNRADKYPFSINSYELRRALINGRSMEFINGCMNAPYNSDEHDESLIFRQLLAESVDKNFWPMRKAPVNLNDMSTIGSTGSRADAARALIELWRATIDRMSWYSAQFTGIGNPTFSRVDDMVIICTPEVKAAGDVQALMAAYNPAYGDSARFVTVPDFGNITSIVSPDNLQAIMLDKDSFMVWDTILEMESLPQWDLNIQYQLHHHGVYSMSPFTNGCLFVFGDDVVDGVLPVPRYTYTSTQSTIDSITDLSTGQSYTLSGAAGNYTTAIQKGRSIKIGYTLQGTSTATGSANEATSSKNTIPQAVSILLSQPAGEPVELFTQVDGYVHLHTSELETSETVTLTIKPLDIPGASSMTLTVTLNDN